MLNNCVNELILNGFGFLIYQHLLIDLVEFPLKSWFNFEKGIKLFLINFPDMKKETKWISLIINQLFFVVCSSWYAGFNMTGNSCGCSWMPIKITETRIDRRPVFFSIFNFFARIFIKSEIHYGYNLNIFPKSAYVFFLVIILGLLIRAAISGWMFSAISGVQMFAKHESVIDTSCTSPFVSCYSKYHLRRIGILLFWRGWWSWRAILRYFRGL